jgi:tRNA A-37 threonylcarbamoyl transferase component Bud32/ADP-ribose pyrophosphatase YjhB (NUDIX family)
MMKANKESLPAETSSLLTRRGGNEMPPASLEGQTLGKYRVLEPLGRGGMARVYRAYHPQLDRYVAIKVLRSDLVEDKEFLTRFQREARAVAALRHPNIVQVFDSDVQEDVYYIVLELLEGDTLKVRLNDYRARGEKMPLGEIVRILLDVLDGLAYAHGEGMIHRDIKPANILLTSRGQAVVADFGIAQIVGGTRHTVAGALMGTLNYMAPEQGMEGRSDACSDIYSLGIVFYEMLTQRTPFEADTPLAVLMKHVNDPLPLPCKIDPTIPEPFERIALKALAKDPEDRYQGAEEMAQALREAAEEAGIELPERISLPLFFTTAEGPSESVAVFSGTARERIADAQFAADDTDATLGQRLAAERAEVGQALSELGKELLSATGTLGRLAVGRMAKVLHKAVEAAKGGLSEATSELEAIPSETPPEETPDEQPADADMDGVLAQRLQAERAEVRPERGKVVRAILGAVGIVAICNSMMLMVSLPTDWWALFEHGWPIQLFLASLGLCIVMWTTSSIWMLIPIGIISGTGILLTYCSLTGNWDQWVFLWVFELWFVVGSVAVPILLAKRKEQARKLSRLIALLIGISSSVLISIIAFAATMKGLFN